MKHPVFSKVFRESCFIIADKIHGKKGVWAYESFEYLNATYFNGRLPWPFLNWALTPHGGCVAWSCTVCDKSTPPIITLHPSLLAGTEKLDPWGIAPNWLGEAFAFDTLLHECMHVHISYNLGGHDGKTSHNCARWIRQVNRLAPMLGFNGVHAGISKTIRVKDRTAPRTKRGKLATKVVRRTVGNVPFAVAAGFPHSLRSHFGRAENYYTKNLLPKGAPRLSPE